MFNPEYTADYVRWDKCRLCGSNSIINVGYLGDQYVSDFVEPGKEKEGIQCPIILDQCKNCTLVQSRFTTRQDFLYTRHYWYRSGVTNTMKEALRNVTRAIEETVDLQNDSVLDIGSNDGTLLRSYSEPVFTIGFEPATNLLPEAKRDIDYLVSDFWDYQNLKDNFSIKPKVITALGMFYDLEDPRKFINDIKLALHPEGVFVSQLMCLAQTLHNYDVGNFAHEHLEFYTLESLRQVFDSVGLEIFRIEENDVNGGSYRIWCKHKDCELYPVESNVQYAFEDEKELHSTEHLIKWFSELRKIRDILSAFVKHELVLGSKVFVLGASTKGNVILQWLGLDNSSVSGASERSPEKVGLVTAGTGIPIYSEEEARKHKPDIFLILPYAFADEIIEREQEFLDRGGRFLIPFVIPRVVYKKDGIIHFTHFAT